MTLFINVFDPVLLEGIIGPNALDNLTVTESVGVHLKVLPRLDDAVSVVEHTRVTVGSIVVTESVTVEVVSFAPVPDAFDTVTIVEATTVHIFVQPDVNDAVGITELAVGHLRSFVDVFDAVTITEDVTAHLLVQPSVADAVAVTESVTAIETQLVPNVNDVVTVTESVVTGALLLPVSAQDAVSVAEAVTVDAHQPFPSVSDAITVTEAPAVNISDISDVFIGVFDTVTVVSFVATAGLLSIDLADVVTVTEAPTPFLPKLPLSVFDNVSAVEARDLFFSLSTLSSVAVTEDVVITISAFQDIFIGVNDPVSVTEDVTTRLRIFISESDDVTLSTVLSPSVGDAVSVTESPFIAVVVTGTLVINAFDIVTLDDTLQMFAILAGDTVTLTEAQTVHVRLLPDISDDVTITEATGRNMRVPPEVSDAITVAEQVTALLPVLVPAAADTITVTDPANVAVTTVGVLTVSVFDALILTEEAARMMLVSMDVNDGVVVVEGIVPNLLVLVKASEALTVTDSAGFVGPLVSAFDSVTVTDAIVSNVVNKPQPFSAVTVTELVTVRLSMSVNVFDSVTLTEATTVAAVTVSVLQVSVSDIVTLTEQTALAFNPIFVTAFDGVIVMDDAVVVGPLAIWTSEEAAVGVWVEAPAIDDAWTSEIEPSGDWS